MFRVAKIRNFNIWERQNLEFQCLQTPKSRIPMFGKAKIHNSNLWKTQKERISMIGIGKIPISIV